MTVVPILTHVRENTNTAFNTEIQVGSLTVMVESQSVRTITPIGTLTFTPEQACTYAAALQAVAVHVMEQNEEVAA
ncbi:hypothetical protein [Leucobacter chromiireducens]|uniref:Uncharacterized protein n=1 Tax=Leucobacter chromiireducens subsp. chromiireducens TaxID=660067 RepID=A0ABS1SLB9_9MICO|nr:hypothetical protein [Leucobacter chromiireducens]MBL3688949.1 hypothetical protein [Leucobacter chromiireducens subsp. chromiireducens]